VISLDIVKKISVVDGPNKHAPLLTFLTFTNKKLCVSLTRASAGADGSLLW
jgi:hypothetical protein